MKDANKRPEKDCLVADESELMLLKVASQRVSLHIRILYSCVVVFMLGCLLTFVLFRFEIQQLRAEVDLRDLVWNALEAEDIISLKKNGSEEHRKEVVYNFIRNRGNLLKRRARTKRNDVETEEVHEEYVTEDDGGSGATTASLDDGIWMNTYSRIQVEALHSYCSTMSEHCPPGKIGEPGLPGIPGEQGLPGMPGSNGPEGPRGGTGLKGDPGIQGPKGDMGIPGPVGPEGPKGHHGHQGEIGPPGVPGETGLKGDKGETGLHGDTGLTGLPGLDGVPGLPGFNGEKGSTGINGEKGDQGIDGSQGSDGTPGLQGITGEQGPKKKKVPTATLR